MNFLLTTLLVAIGTSIFAQSPTRPLFREFVGLCGHTVQFKPELYQPVCRVVRDYHPVKWDLAKDTSVMPEWPFAKNRVSWEKVYRSWHDKGLSISVCFQFDDMKAEDWKDIERDARAYAKGFAEHFGPGGKYPFVDTVEVGNEPGHIDDALYLRVFTAMAAGLREGNPKLKIATCNTEAGGSDRYWKGADIFTPYLPQIDVLRIHRYAIKEGWPTWKRSYPEDSTVPYFNDDDKPAFHACSGITRNFQPKPSYHAIAWMLKHLADYRFNKAILKSEKEGYLFEFTPEKPGGPKILAAWHATRENVTLDLKSSSFSRAERMPLTGSPAEEILPKLREPNIAVGTLPILLWMR
ncbi:MAG: hypothetical protein NTV80_17085 [Verrucomicrobia bacterium]|nr:hypothetical protein [Verrucomicrobiota bacterium]